MAGLLDDVGTWLNGDDTTKDANGLTQADRREPYWLAASKGLSTIGGLLMASGQKLMPEQRAQYLGQIGGALAGIPQDILAAREAQSKQILQQQTVTANRTKLANQAKIQAMAKTPEAIDAMSKMDPLHRTAMQAAYDAGDIDKVVSIIGSLDKTATASALLDLKKQGIDNSAQALDVRRQAMENANANKLQEIQLKQLEHERKQLADAQKAGGLPSDPTRSAHGFLIKALEDSAFAATPQYSWALDYLSKPQKLPDGSFSDPIDKKRYPAATHPSATGQPVQGADGSQPAAPKTPEQMADELEPGKEATLPNGITVSKDVGGTIEWHVPGVGDNEGTRYQRAPGGRTTQLPPLKPIPTPEATLLTNTRTSLESLDELEREMKKPGVQLGDLESMILPNNVLNRTNPEGTRARALIAEIAAKKVHDLSGAAVTPAEFSRLESFIPTKGDKPETIQSKLVGMKRELENIGRAHYQNIASGSKVTPELRSRFGGAATAPARSKTYNPDTGRLE